MTYVYCDLISDTYNILCRYVYNIAIDVMTQYDMMNKDKHLEFFKLNAIILFKEEYPMIRKVIIDVGDIHYKNLTKSNIPYTLIEPPEHHAKFYVKNINVYPEGQEIGRDEDEYRKFL